MPTDTVKVAIQNAIRTKLKAGSYPTVLYTSEHEPYIGPQELPANVVVNDISGTFGMTPGQTSNYNMSNWRFEATLDFKSEVDVTDYLMSFNLSFTHEQFAIIIGLDGSYEVKHPVTQGSHNGTQATITFVATIKQ